MSDTSRKEQLEYWRSKVEEWENEMAEVRKELSALRRERNERIKKHKDISEVSAEIREKEDYYEYLDEQLDQEIRCYPG